VKKFKNKPRICVVTYPGQVASIAPLSNLVEILSEISESLYLITGNEGKNVLNAHPKIGGYSINYKLKQFIIARIFDHFLLQAKIAIRILKINRDIDIYVFYMGAGLILPMSICRAVKKPVLLALAASLNKMLKNDKRLLSRMFIFLENSNYRMSNKIILYSDKLIAEWNLKKYSNKICFAHEHIIDINKFKCKKLLVDRKNIIGYIGRLSSEKGIMNFVKSMPYILDNCRETVFMVGGDGPLTKEIKEYINDNNLQSHVKIMGWIPHQELPEYLNDIKLLVLPSFTEGLPNIMLEAMACGTPVLTTPVGSIPDFIEDGETGFIMEDNSPKSLAQNVFRGLSHPNMDIIAKNARRLVEQEFSFEKAVESYKDIIALTLISDNDRKSVK
jgi:glycosyltransferase involved in cell wall biosynthesis